MFFVTGLWPGHENRATSSSGFSAFQPIRPLGEWASRRHPRLHHPRLRSCLRSRLRSRRRTCGRTKGGGIVVDLPYQMHNNYESGEI